MDYSSLIEQRRDRFAEVETLITDPDLFSNPKKGKAVMSEHSRLKGLLEMWETLQTAKTNLEENRELAKEDDPEMAEMAAMTQNMGRNLRVKDKGRVRASEKAAPAKDGNLLHQFGASDRQTPDASSTHASIPQALTLLNGREVGAVSDRKGAAGSLPALIRSARSDNEKLDILYVAIYGCYPTNAERSKYLKHMVDGKSMQVFAKAMLNSKRFLFVQ